jgi:RNA polymerase sigma-70 factor (ECF subfamily)
VGRLKDPADAQAWREFDQRYRDLIVRFLRCRGLQLADAEDCAQAVLAKLVTGLRAFQYDAARGGFRAYLYRCARSALADFFARKGKASAPATAGDATPVARGSGAATEEDPLFAEFERQWVDHHYRIAVARLRETADARTIAMLDATIAGRPARDVAQEMGMTEAAVHKAHQRVRDRLRTLIEEQVRDEEPDDARPPR